MNSYVAVPESVERESERLRLFDYVPPEEGGHN